MLPPRRSGMEPSLDKTPFPGRAAESIGAARSVRKTPWMFYRTWISLRGRDIEGC